MKKSSARRYSLKAELLQKDGGCGDALVGDELCELQASV